MAGARERQLYAPYGGDVKTWPAVNGSGTLRSLITSVDGAVWAAAKSGLIRLKDGNGEKMDRSNGLPCDSTFTLIFDAAGSLWLYAECGLVEISSAELARWSAHPEGKVKVRRLDILDGAQPGATLFAPGATLSPDGRLWFANDSVLQVVDPRRLRLNAIPPPVRVEQVLADGKSYSAGGMLRLPALTRSVQIDYTALSFTAPQRVKFRYRLEGRGFGSVDDAWVEAGGRRQAFYNDLPPGTYRFSVIACNNNWIWNDADAAQVFTVSPTYYQTIWFRAFLVISAALGMWGIYRFRFWQIADALNARFEERIAERNRLSADLQDTFLQVVQASRMIADHALGRPSADARQLTSTIARMSEWLARAVADGQAVLNLMHASVSLDDDLEASFRKAAELLHVSRSMDFTLSVEGTARALHPIARDDVYRIGVEAIRISFLHSGAARIVLQLTYGTDLMFRLSDDGKRIPGIHYGTGGGEGSGLARMQKLATGIGAQLQLLSREGAGTEIELRVPGRIAYADFRGKESGMERRRRT